MNARSWLERPGAGGMPTEVDAKELARAYGIPIPRGLVVPATSVRAGSAARPEFPGPYAVKVASPSILHKTDSGALRLGVVAGELDATLAEFADHFPGEWLLVEEMVRTAGEIDQMVDELRLAPLLRGYRGISTDRPALVGMLEAVGRIVVDLADRFVELDINPLVYSGREWVALDVKVVLAGGEEPDGGHADDCH